jgi:LDH2 family malate/lactate/ureidoglycolate dehydrogenase
MEDGGQVFYPGQQTWLRRRENERKGIPVNRDTWDMILALDKG